MAQAPRPFTSGSYAQIIAGNPQGPLVIVFWSLACAHCQEELALLGQLARAHPGLAVVLVSTDTPADAGAVEETLRRHGLADAPSWVFADEPPERLRFEVDRRWRGELPRTHLIAPGQPPRVSTGRIERSELEKWLQTQSTP
jgi:thiol-disulfide isomerase/thioredoxin